MKTLVLLMASAVAVDSAAQPTQVVYLPGDGVTLPKALSEVRVQYTPEAMRARLAGSILLEGIVQADGTVTDVHVVRPLDPGLDREAVNAFKRWRFLPGRKDGQPVAVRVTAEMAFSLAESPFRGGNSVRVFSRTERDGTTTTFEISEERFRQLPAGGHDGAAGHMSLQEVIGSGADWIRRTPSESAATTYRLVNATAARIGDSDRWYYVLNFSPDEEQFGTRPILLTAVVLGDGSVVEPSKRP